MTGDPGRRPLRLAHRGDWRQAPENTIAALLAALEIPSCDGLEFDVRMSADHVPVLLHDLSLARVQGVDARVGALSADALGSHGVPTLAAALTAVDERRPGTFLDVELKSTDHGQATAEVLRAARGDAPGDAVVSSFEDAALMSMADVLPGWGRWLNADDLSPSTIARAVGLGCSGISVQFRALDRDSLDRGHDAGLDVAAWTIRTRPDAEQLSAVGLVAICVEDEALDD